MFPGGGTGEGGIWTRSLVQQKSAPAMKQFGWYPCPLGWPPKTPFAMLAAARVVLWLLRGLGASQVMYWQCCSVDDQEAWWLQGASTPHCDISAGELEHLRPAFSQCCCLETLFLTYTAPFCMQVGAGALSKLCSSAAPSVPLSAVSYPQICKMCLLWPLFEEFSPAVWVLS